MSKNTLTVAQGQKVSPLKWYEYSQNNSGGSFDHDPDAGIGYAVWVQARNYEEANRRAEQIGLYFDGEGDCSCCGDRWSDKWYESDGQTEEPTVYAGRYSGADENGLRWGLPTYAHRYDGTFYVVTARTELE
jgi:hypothetical protein